MTLQALMKALALAGACRMLSGVAHGLQQPIFALLSHVTPLTQMAMHDRNHLPLAAVGHWSLPSPNSAGIAALCWCCREETKSTREPGKNLLP